MREALGKSAGQRVVEMAQGSISEVREFIPCGVSVIDHHLLGGGGLHVGRLTELFGDEGTGKAQPLEAGVLTPNGYRPIGDLRVGDAIIGADGQAHQVVGVFPQGEKAVYRITMNDGGSTECCDEHLWFTYGSNDVARGKPGKVRALSEIRSNLREPHGKYDSWRHHIPVVAPVAFVASAEPLPLDPYLLGLLLGDGCFRGAAVTFNKPERDLWRAIETRLPEYDGLSPLTHNDGVRIIGGGERSETARRLEELGLLGKLSTEKHIPPQYLSASAEDRLALLQGLVDTDGSVGNAGWVEYSTSSSHLAAGFMHLARSLGAIVSQTSRTPTYTYRGERRTGALSYRIGLQMRHGLCPVASEKNLARWKPRAWTAHRSIVDVTYVGEKECVCIKTSAPDSLYVTDDFIVTHNTSLVFAFMAGAQRAGGYVGLAETENALQVERAVAFGVDPAEVVLTHPETLEEALANAEAFMRNLPEGAGPNLWVLDSIAAAATAAEIENGAGGALRVGEFARRMSHGIKQLCALAARTRTALLLTNQTRQKIGISFGNPTTTPGGNAVKFAASVRLQLMGGSSVKVDEMPVGKDVTVMCVKIKLIPPFHKAKARLLYDTGWHEPWTLLTHAKNVGAVGAKAQGMKGYREALAALGWPEPVSTGEVAKDALDALSEAEAHAELTGETPE